MAKSLAKLLSAIMVEEIRGPKDRMIESLTADSRQAKAGAMFVAVVGVNVDGHQFIDTLPCDVAAVVCERLPRLMHPEVTYIRVSNSAVALGFLASAWYDHPSQRLELVGVTGTNGKTTTATLLYEMARLMGEKAGLLSTVVNYVDTTAVAAHQTTPDPITINALLAQMVDAGCTFAAMEVSSHAADQHRIAGLHFKGGIFTNLTRDHLDYHKTVDAYLKAKKSFFDTLSPTAFALTNIDDKVGRIMVQNTHANVSTYSLREHANFTGRIVESRLDGTALRFNGHEVHTRFTGLFNAYNLTAVYGASILTGWNRDDVLLAMSRLEPVAGRFQTFQSPQGYTAIVDYAHTPDAIVNVIEAIRAVIGHSGSIITVVGAGGNRDKGKRPIMAAEAARLSDHVILTSDNPRYEQPEDILADMAAGLTPDDRKHTDIVVDRREAINAACRKASKGDVILIAGKGHEDYQEIQGVKHHFDDREEVMLAMKDNQTS